ncbi:YdeI/OmpD-associated family protein [Caproiciproducens faecalis]|uniref:YdeI/OmpD-associated family protein n=1 Tax=Caproiciproducens faecalis TaxID=2820301 RepID=A0ABS7DQP3_9FIRM|nr:YdeI/OmpD-associated family protein [Caproiciproducens faecalis]MBW7573625.1 YdeI/OmpD-associated family protein [Caproiciproducens faecalis]
MPEDLHCLLQADTQARHYFESLPKYAQEAAKQHTKEITTADGLHLFVETFMRDDSYQGA